MKLFLIAALFVLALTHGSSAQDGGDQMSHYIENIKAKINQNFVNKQELKDRAESFLEDRQMEIEPLAAKVQGQLQELEEQIKPLTANIREKVNPLIASLHQKMESVLQLMAEQDKTSP